MIFTFIAVGLIAHVSPMRYVIAMKRACSNVSGIVFQYPFYAGIMGIMMFTGLGTLISNWMTSHATVQTMPLVAQFAGAVVNFAVPSAGGEWAVIGPALTEAAKNLASTLPAEQVEPFVSRIAMSVAYGETSTNLLQPFFLLIILPVMAAGVRIQARDVLGYLVIPFVYIAITTALLVQLRAVLSGGDLRTSPSLSHWFNLFTATALMLSSGRTSSSASQTVAKLAPDKQV